MNWQIVSRNRKNLFSISSKRRYNGAHLIKILFLVLLIVLASAVAGCLNSSKSFQFSGSSMEPTLHDGDKIKAFPVNRLLERGDIVVFASPEDPDITSVKRIIGLPNETIEIKDSHVLINGIILDEPYVSEPALYSHPSTVIPDKSYFLLGDNRMQSSDSHNFGTVIITNIQYIVEME